MRERGIRTRETEREKDEREREQEGGRRETEVKEFDKGEKKIEKVEKEKECEVVSIFRAYVVMYIRDRWRYLGFLDFGIEFRYRYSIPTSTNGRRLDVDIRYQYPISEKT